MSTESVTPEPIKKVSIIVSKGSLEGIYPALIMANGARAEGMEANLFFTFFGLDAIHKTRIDHIKVATVGNPAMHIPTLIGGLPETQEMLDFCGQHGITSDIEMIRMDQINEAYERMLKGDVRYRFVIDMASIH